MLFVMLIWVSIANGGPTTIQGFVSLEACEASRPVVEKVYWKYGATTTCVALENR